jgi:hypothetical protein
MNAQMRDEIVPNRFSFRISVNKNNRHRIYLPTWALSAEFTRAGSAGYLQAG